jgi:acetyl-CoA synthetase
MTSEIKIPIKDHVLEYTHINKSKYKQMYDESLRDPEAFWGQQAEALTWYKKWDKVKDVSFLKPISIQWYLGGELNVSYNCIDRHLSTNANKIAFIWEPDNPHSPAKKISYRELSIQVNKFANVLKKQGVKKRR